MVAYKGGKCPFKDKQFSIVFSNAVIEHVGDFKDELLFLEEMKRVGNAFYFTTPAKEFPVELHTNFPFVHWFAKDVFNRVVNLSGKGWASGDYMNLLGRREIEALLRRSGVTECKIFTQRLGPFPLHYSVYGR